MAEEAPQLTDKQRLFAQHYVACLNATEAAARAGYSGDRVTLAAVGYENLRKPQIRALIDELLSEASMSPAEILGRLTAIARGDLGDFFTASGRGVRLDIKRAMQEGRTALLKSYSKTDKGVRIELYDAAAALSKLGEYHKLWSKHDLLAMLDLSKLSNEQIDRIAAGEDPMKVVFG